jgi:putative hydrolase of the HAD superfamily
MPIHAVVFDIGGVLEYTPDLSVITKWEQDLGLKPGEIRTLLHEAWRGGSIGTFSEEQVHQRIGKILGMSRERVNAFMEDIWEEYLGTPNTELISFFRGLPPAPRLQPLWWGEEEHTKIDYLFLG